MASNSIYKSLYQFNEDDWYNKFDCVTIRKTSGSTVLTIDLHPHPHRTGFELIVKYENPIETIQHSKCCDSRDECVKLLKHMFSVEN